MKVLHIGFGFRPWRGGGLIEYAEDLMEEQSKHGYQVFYFCSGRHYPIVKRTFLKRWMRSAISIIEVINPPIYHGGDSGTAFDIESPVIEKLFYEVLCEIKPDIVHIQELAGLPSSLIDIVAAHGTPMVMTLQDYHLLCPTLKLFDYQYTTCEDDEPSQKCVLCVRDSPAGIRHQLVRNTLRYEAKRILPDSVRKSAKTLYDVISHTKAKSLNLRHSARRSHLVNDLLVDFFRTRRQVNVERLKRVDLLLAQSSAVERIYRQIAGVENIRTLHLTVKHIEYIHPKVIKINPDFRVKFGTINGLATVPKGARLLLEAIEILKAEGLGSQFELHVFGGIDKDIQTKVKEFSNVYYHGFFDVNELDRIMEPLHVGIIPSVWEEAYGYVGVEFLAKGIPVIGNLKGGIVDYVLDDVTGWLNVDNNAAGLAKIMKRIIGNPAEIEKLNRKIMEIRGKLIKTMEQHFYEIDHIYGEIIAAKRRT